MMHGDKFNYEGRTFRVTIECDDVMVAPWNECDGHGVVSEWVMRDKFPHERVLRAEHNRMQYYDLRASRVIAMRDGWGSDNEPEGLSQRAKAARAVMADFTRMRAWCDGEWHYAVVKVTLLDDDGGEIANHSVCGVESDSDLTETAHDLALDLHVEQCASDIARALARVQERRKDATLLAALRYYQSLPREQREFDLIATDGGEFESLSECEIDSLCEELNA